MPGLENVTSRYTWAGCCNGTCNTVADLCQPNAAAAATCAARSDGGAPGCTVCLSGTCSVDPLGQGAVTTVWDWLNQLNAASFTGHGDWRLPSEAGQNTGASTPRELETILNCAAGSPCIAPIFGSTAADAYWSATPSATLASNVWVVSFASPGAVSTVNSINAFYVRAVR